LSRWLIPIVAVGIVLADVPRGTAAPRRPDIIVIVTDDQRRGTFDWLPTVQRRIVRRGLMFSRAMVPTSLCCPSRASLLTGVYSHTTRVWSNTQGWRRFRAAGMQRRTMAVWLRRSGYRTGLVGKYLNAFSGDVPPRGWSAWHSFRGVNAAYYDYELLHTDGSVSRYGSDPRAYSTDVLRRHATRFVNGSRTRPFFLYFAPYAPHGPATPAPRHASLKAPVGAFRPPSFNEQDVTDKPRWIRELPPVNATAIDAYRQAQYRSLRSVDEAIAAMVDAQRARHRFANTLWIVISDNGDMWGEHRVSGKFVPYAGATRVPLAIAWPGHLESGGRDARLALNIDVAATVADAANATHDPIDGRSLLRRWVRSGFVLEAGGTRNPGPHGTNVSRPSYCGWRTRRFLFVHYANGREELYRYAADPWELIDVHRRARFHARLTSLRRRSREACRPVPPGFSWG
jgi:arylsulfatase A-like enzyme